MSKHLFQSVATMSTGMALSLTLCNTASQAVELRTDEVSSNQDFFLATVSETGSRSSQLEAVNSDSETVGDFGLGILLSLGVVVVFAVLEERRLRRKNAQQNAQKKAIQALQANYPPKQLATIPSNKR